MKAVTHGFALGAFGIDQRLDKNETRVIEFYASKPASRPSNHRYIAEVVTRIREQCRGVHGNAKHGLNDDVGKIESNPEPERTGVSPHLP